MERPLRLAVDLSEERVEAFFDACVEADEVALGDVIHDLADELGPGPHFDFTGFLDAAEAAMRVRGIKMTAKRKRLLQSRLGETDEIADPVVGKVHGTGTLADPIRGWYEVGKGRTRRVGGVRGRTPRFGTWSLFRSGKSAESRASCGVRSSHTHRTPGTSRRV